MPRIRSSASQALELLPVDIAAEALVQLTMSAPMAMLSAAAEPATPASAAEAIVVAHVDARAFALAPIALGALLAPLGAACGGLRTVPYSTWRQQVREAGGEAEAALAVAPPSDAGDEMCWPSTGQTMGLQRCAVARVLGHERVYESCAAAMVYTEAMWETWAACLVAQCD